MFLAVSGSVALLGTDPAFAASSIPNVTQSLVTSFGDLGDISSGFASVRESSFCTEPGTISSSIPVLLNFIFCSVYVCVGFLAYLFL